MLRVSPADSAAPGAVVTVVFDRPVRPDQGARATLRAGAGAAVAADVRWADPVTLQLVPHAPLTPRLRYEVRLAPGMVAEDGGHLDATDSRPGRYTFAVRPPRVTASTPSLAPVDTAQLDPGGVARLWYDAPLSPAALARGAQLTFPAPATGAPTGPARAGAAPDTAASCAGHASVTYTASQRPVAPGEPDAFGRWPRRPGDAGLPGVRPDRFQRLVELRPTAPVPEGCLGILTLPPADPTAAPVRYAARTAAPFVLAGLAVDDASDSTVVVVLTAPVRRTELLAHLHLEPARPFTIAPLPWGDEPLPRWTLRTRVERRAVLRAVADPELRDTTGRPIAPGGRVTSLAVPGRAARVAYDVGLLAATPGTGAGSLPVIRVRHVNVRRAELVVWPVPDSLRAAVLGAPTLNAAMLSAFGVDSVGALVDLPAPRDTERVTSVPLPAASARPDVALWAVRFRVAEPSTAAPVGRGADPNVVETVVAEPAAGLQSLALLQRGELAVHLKGAAGDGAAVLVTRRPDGRPVAGARVTLFDSTGAIGARGLTDASGLATLVAAASTPPSAPPGTPSSAPPPAAPHQSPRAAAGHSRRGPASAYGPWPALVEVAAQGTRIVEPLGGWRYWDRNGAMLFPFGLGATPGMGVRSRGALYPDREFYRPGERVHLAGVVREGLLGALHPPPPGDSVRVRVVAQVGRYAEEEAAVRDTTLRVDAFGMLADSLRIAPAAPLGTYAAMVALWRHGQWQDAARTTFRVAEYRAPEFRVDLTVDSTPHLLGDTIGAHVAARLLLDAPMPGATLRWNAQLTEGSAAALPGLGPEWTVGDRNWVATGGPGPDQPSRNEQHAGTLTLDRRSEAELRVPTSRALFSRPGTLTVSVAVTDLNRQTVTRSASVPVHAARVYLAAHDSAHALVWRVGTPRTLRVLAVRPDGRPVGTTRVRVAVVSARWEQNGAERGTSRWVVDTVARDSLVTPAVRPGAVPGDTSAARTVHVTPPRAGFVAVVLRATDEDGRPATTVLPGWAVGTGGELAWWGDEDPVRIPMRATQPRLAPGDTAEVHFTSPFPEATAWVTVERERVLRTWTVAVARGPQVLRFPVSAADAPNVYVGVTLVPRSAAARSAAGADTALAAPLDRGLRAGYALLTVEPTAQRLAVAVAPHARVYAPGDTARVTVRVTDARGRGAPAAVALWAVDEGVLALGDYVRPAPLGALYMQDGVGWMLGSTLTHLGTLWPPWFSRIAFSGKALEGAPLGGAVRSERRFRRTGSEAPLNEVVLYEYERHIDRESPPPPPSPQVGAPTPRTEFRSTAFFLGGIRTGPDGVAEARAVLPGNLTSFRVVAVAATAGDAYGGGDTTLVATKPLAIRAALPRFVRAGDSLRAGAVVTWRDTAAVGADALARLRVRVRADAFSGLVASSTAQRDTALSPGGSAELRWSWRAAADTAADARVQFSAIASTVAGDLGATHARSGAPLSDAIAVAIPVRPAYVPRSYAITGTLAGAVGVVSIPLPFPAELDLARSRLTLSAGPTPAPAVRAIAAQLATYPYDCTEQLTSLGRALVALLRLGPGRGEVAVSDGAPGAMTDARARLQGVVDAVARRQRPDGAIGYWESESWSTAWLSAEVGRVLLDARAAGAEVPEYLTARLTAYLRDTTRAALPRRDSLFGTATERGTQAARLLAGRLAALAYLRRAGQAQRPAEDSLIARAGELVWEDRVALTSLLAARGDSAHARALLDTLWGAVGRAGARAELPDSVLRTVADFPSRVRPVARLLLVTRAIRPNDHQLGELAAALQQRAAADRRGRWWVWNTQDLAAAAEGLAAVADPRAADDGADGPSRPDVRVAAADGRALVMTAAGVPLTGLVREAGRGGVLTVRVARESGDGVGGGSAAPTVPTFCALTVTAVPRTVGDTPVGGTPAVRAAREDRGLTVERWVEPLAGGRAVGDVGAGALVRVRLRVTAPADREFVALEDPLPAGLEPVDLTLRTSGTLAPFATRASGAAAGRRADDATDGPDDESEGDAGGNASRWRGWGGWWSPWEHVEQRDDAVRWFARRLRRGTYAVSYVARATTAGRFARVPAHAEEMYNPALTGRTEGGTLTVRDSVP